MRMLITGAAGLLGHDVTAAASAGGIDSVALTHAELDITDPRSAHAVMADVAPDVVINCAGWTDVDGAESRFDTALAVNGTGPGHLARVAADHGAWMIHISSDYVFDGAKHEPYVESDPPAPLSAYGQTKLAGEGEVAAAAPQGHTIVRSSWLFGLAGPCFPKTILRLAGERDRLEVVDDQVGCPTFTGHLAAGLLELARRRPLGVIHMAGAGACSWYEFARAVVELADLACEIRPVPTSRMPRAARRPAYSVLGTERPGDATALPAWRAGLERFLADVVRA